MLGKIQVAHRLDKWLEKAYSPDHGSVTPGVQVAKSPGLYCPGTSAGWVSASLFFCPWIVHLEILESRGESEWLKPVRACSLAGEEGAPNLHLYRAEGEGTLRTPRLILQKGSRCFEENGTPIQGLAPHNTRVSRPKPCPLACLPGPLDVPNSPAALTTDGLSH